VRRGPRVLSGVKGQPLVKGRGSAGAEVTVTHPWHALEGSVAEGSLPAPCIHEI
jgi:hypothetical protein